MGGKSDEIKGHIKQAGGELTGNEKLKREGELDEAGGKIKQGAEKIVDKTKEALRPRKDEADA
jgi:uncharacterized protein YjbJ (UPF0337 family)